MTLGNLEDLLERPDSPVAYRSSVTLQEMMPNDSILHNLANPNRPEADSVFQPQNVGDQEASIKMLCEMHKAPAVFFSEKEDRYVCFKCLVKTEKLLYIDKSYQNEMEDFERIKALCAEAITSNIKNTSIIKKWKYEIRSRLMDIRTRFNE